MFEASSDGFKVVHVLLDDAQAAENAQRRRIERHGMAAKGLLQDPQDSVIVCSLVAGELLGGLLDSFLVQWFQVEGKRGLENLLKKADDALRTNFGLRKAGESLFQFPDRAHAHFVPVEELFSQGSKCLVGLLARRVF